MAPEEEAEARKSMSIQPTIVQQDALDRLAQHAEKADGMPLWPEESWKCLTEIGVNRWCIPKAYGGEERDTLTLLEGYRDLASGCLTTCFLLSQRDAACRRLRDSDNSGPAKRLLPLLANGSHFATVGIAQLTTSRQHGKPAMLAEETDQGFLLTGAMPWVTGAAQADSFITGGTLEDGRQVLGVVSAKSEGLQVDEPLDLMSFQGSLTSLVHCHQVRMASDDVLAGPVEKVTSTIGRGGPGGLETSCLALGLTLAALRYLKQEARHRLEWQEPGEWLEQRYESLWGRLLEIAESGAAPEQLVSLRADANHLVLQTTQTALTASKGSGFLRSHPAQRWARQALFFLVWACPRPAVDATMASLIPCL